MQENIKKFIQQNSPDGGFLQSNEWLKFQEAVGRKTHNVFYPHPSNPSVPSGHLPLERGGENEQGEGDICFWANIIEHQLPVVGKYFYIPRGPIMPYNIKHETCNIEIQKMIDLARKNNAGWIRIEPANKEILKLIKSWTFDVHNGHQMSIKIIKAPHDMQPREILVMDISKSEEEVLGGMKQKTRYNIRIAEKKGVKIIEDRKYIDEFIKLTKIMAKRQGIIAHPDEYYRKMVEVIPENILKLYIAEYQGKIIAANLAVFYGNTCTYLHGASYNEYRNVMAPYLLQWKQIQDARATGCERYDFGGIKSYNIEHKTCNKNTWGGITKFKTGFSPNTRPVEFLGCYDVVISEVRYRAYRLIQKVKSFIR